MTEMKEAVVVEMSTFKKMRQTRLCFSDGKLVAKLPVDEIKKEHFVNVSLFIKLP